jgi:hypothetical protein
MMLPKQVSCKCCLHAKVTRVHVCWFLLIASCTNGCLFSLCVITAAAATPAAAAAAAAAGFLSLP